MQSSPLSYLGVEVEVQGVAEVGVEGDDTKTGGGADIVGTIVGLDGADCLSWKPAGPVVGQAVVQPLDTTARRGGREEIGWAGLVVSDGRVDFGSKGGHDAVGVGGLGDNGLLGLGPDIVRGDIAGQNTKGDVGNGGDVGHHVLAQLDGNIALVVTPG